jgi:ribosomal protein S12 methylthiotransferase accessory factor
MKPAEIGPATSLRVCPLSATLERATAAMGTLGIETLEDATAEDILGVPVWFSTRPGGLAGSVHAGKGVLPLQAQVGALMEAVEFAVAEREAARSQRRQRSLSELLRQFTPPIELTDLAPRLGASATASAILNVEPCEDLHTGRRIDMPAELVLVPAPAGSDPALFGWDSNGLASGNSRDEATLHALLEVLERDTIALDLARPAGRPLDAARLPAPLGEWAQRWREQGIALRVRWLPNAFGLPCFAAEIGQPGGRPALGWGLHLDRQVALARAVTEAAQSRLHALRRGRDKLRPGGEAIAHVPAAAVAELAFESLPTLPARDLATALDQVLQRLEREGLRSVLLREMRCEPQPAVLDGLHVVKVIVPGCESAIGAQPRIGRRLAARIFRAG